jgi:3-oxosteroid 1-dehydrogenase
MRTMTDHAPCVAQDDEFDVVVLGAGAGGMTAALVARLEGLRTLLVERSSAVGGTTARSSGTVWVPDNPEQRRRGVQGDAAAARTYLDALVGTRADPALREAFLVAGPGMLRYLEERTDVRFRSYPCRSTAGRWAPTSIASPRRCRSSCSSAA